MGDGYRSDDDAAQARVAVLEERIEELAHADAENAALRARVAALEAAAGVREIMTPPPRPPVVTAAPPRVARRYTPPQEAEEIVAAGARRDRIWAIGIAIAVAAAVLAIFFPACNHR